jgi:branched-chain amino acid transport system ATP-binding protein
MTDRLLELERVAAGYDGSAVVRDIDLSVAPGEIVALLGPNGAGKTTLLRTISGIVRPLAGRGVVVGLDLGGVAPHRLARHGLVHVAEGRSVFAGLTVAEHFRLRSARSQIDADLAYRHFPELRELRDRKAGLLSGGEQQMLALGCAMARGPRLLMVDELSLGLAPAIVGRLLPVIRNFVKDAGVGLLMVEQHVAHALDIADRAIALSHGEIKLAGKAADLRDNSSILVESYLGDVPAAVPTSASAAQCASTAGVASRSVSP